MNFFLKNKWTFSFFILLVMYFIAYSFFPVIFEDGDDIAMQQIIQGSLAGKPDVHLIFINVIIGYILKPLYNFNNQIYWYSSMMVLFQFVSIMVILYYLLLNKTRWYSVLSILLFSLYFIVNLQFTSVSGLLCIAGMLLLKNSISTNSVRNYLISFLLLSFSILLRFEMFLLTFTICFIFLILKFYSEYRLIIRNKKFLFFSFFLSFFIVVSSWINFESYQIEKEWKYYHEYNIARGRFNDNPNIYRVRDEFKKNEKDFIEINLATNFLFSDTYDLLKIRELLDKSKPNMIQILINLYRALHDIPIFIGLLFLSLIAYLFVRKRFYFLVLPIGLVFLFFIYISSEHFLKSRVLYPIILAVVIFSILSEYKISAKKISLGLIIFAIFNFFQFYPKININDEYKNLPKNKFIVLISRYSFSPHPFELNNQNKHENLIRRGWLTNSPLYLYKLREKGFKVNQHLSWIDNEVLNKDVLYHVEVGSPVFYNLNEYLYIKNKKLVPFGLNKNLYQIENIIVQ